MTFIVKMHEEEEAHNREHLQRACWLLVLVFHEKRQLLVLEG